MQVTISFHHILPHSFPDAEHGRNKALYDKLLSPLAPNAMKYYSYHVDSVMGKVHDLQYKISFNRKAKSFQLVSGHMVVSENVWSVREMHF